MIEIAFKMNILMMGRTKIMIRLQEAEEEVGEADESIKETNKHLFSFQFIILV